MTKRKRTQFQIDRERVANLWFDGDTVRADDVFGALPYSSIPSWTDVEAVMEALNWGEDEDEH